MIDVRADFHVHSCLSPCASLEMGPRAIVERAKDLGINVIAISDHNSALNLPAFKTICEKENIFPIFGMEICSQEEVHCLSLFPTLKASLDMGEYVYSKLPQIKNNPEVFGDQVYVDCEENILGEVEIFLGSATTMSFEEVEKEVHLRGGLFIPAHIDRPMYGVISQLGFLPMADYDALEISYHAIKNNDIPKTPEKINCITDTDSHYLETLGVAYNKFQVEEMSFQAIKDALKYAQIEMIINNKYD